MNNKNIDWTDRIVSILLAAIVILLVFAAAASAQTGKFEGVFTGKFTLNGPAATTTPKVVKPAASPAVPKPITFTLRLDDLRQLLADARAAQPAVFAPVPVIVQAPTAPDHAIEAARIQAAGQIEAARIAAQAVVEAARIQKEVESAKLTVRKAELVAELNNRLEVAKINNGRLRDKVLVALIGAGGRLGQGALSRITIRDVGNPSLSNSLSNIGNPTQTQTATLTGGNQVAILRGGNAQASAQATASATNSNVSINDDRWNYRGNGCYVTPFGVICLPKP